MKTHWKILVRIVGVASILLAVGGILYNIMYFTALFGEPITNEQPYFHVAYYTMVSICLAFYATLIWLGYSFIKLNLKYWYIYPLVFILEFIYFYGVGMLWQLENQSIASSVAAATGVANGGLVLQFFTGIFVWGPLLLFFAWLSIRNNGANKTPQPTQKNSAAEL